MRESSRLLPFIYRDMEKKYGQKRSSLKRNARVAGLLLLQNSGRWVLEITLSWERYFSSFFFCIYLLAPTNSTFTFYQRNYTFPTVQRSKYIQACIDLIANYVSNWWYEVIKICLSLRRIVSLILKNINKDMILDNFV